jgi:hypothetical protein
VDRKPLARGYRKSACEPLTGFGWVITYKADDTRRGGRAFGGLVLPIFKKIKSAKIKNSCKVKRLTEEKEMLLEADLDEFEKVMDFLQSPKHAERIAKYVIHILYDIEGYADLPDRLQGQLNEQASLLYGLGFLHGRKNRDDDER